jgi:hypothetical protein
MLRSGRSAQATNGYVTIGQECPSHEWVCYDRAGVPKPRVAMLQSGRSAQATGGHVTIGQECPSYDKFSS